MEEQIRIISGHLELANSKAAIIEPIYKTEQWREVTTPAYYLVFDLANAILASKDLFAKSHEATQKLLSTEFVRNDLLPKDTSSKFNYLMELRYKADYYSLTKFTESDAKNIIKTSYSLAFDMLKIIENNKNFRTTIDNLKFKLNETLENINVVDSMVFKKHKI